MWERFQRDWSSAGSSYSLSMLIAGVYWLVLVSKLGFLESLSQKAVLDAPRLSVQDRGGIDWG